MSIKLVSNTVLALIIIASLAACGGGGGNGISGQSATAITAQPTDKSVVAGTTATFNVVATDATTYQWQNSADGGATFTDVNSATAASHTTAATTLADDGTRYRVVVSGASNSVSSSAVTLSVTTAPVAPGISVQPANQSVSEGQDANFSVTATGTSLSYQWQRSTDGGTSFADVAAATGSTMSLTSVQIADDGQQFRVAVRNSTGSITSNAATLAVVASTPITITTTSPLPAGTVSTPYIVTLSASGGTQPYIWSVSDGYTLPAFLSLNATTGEISGTPTSGDVMYGWEIRVADSANPPHSSQKYFDLTIQALCDTGKGSATVDGAPTTVQGKFCPEKLNGPTGPYADGTIIYAWVETYPYGGGSYYEIVGVRFNPASGLVTGVSFTLHDTTRSWSYSCSVPGTATYPACTGVTVNTGTGKVLFENTTVGSGSSQPFTLNGLLFYTP